MKKKQWSAGKSGEQDGSTLPHLQKKISRRNLLAGVAALGAGSGFLKGAGRPRAADFPASKPRVIALIGDRYHNLDYIRVSLDQLFSEIGLPVDYTIRYDHLSRNLLNGYRILVCFRDGMIWLGGYLGPDAYNYERELENPGDFPKAEPKDWITQKQAEVVRDFVAAGNGLYCLHNSSHISLFSPTYREVMGGAYIGHPHLRPFKVRIVNHRNPITEGVDDFMVNDEQHYVTYDKDPGNILLKAENIDRLGYDGHGTKSISGWAHDYGKGRVALTAVGHTIHAMWAPQYLKLLKRAVQVAAEKHLAAVMPV